MQSKTFSKARYDNCSHFHSRIFVRISPQALSREQNSLSAQSKGSQTNRDHLFLALLHETRGNRYLPPLTPLKLLQQVDTTISPQVDREVSKLKQFSAKIRIWTCRARLVPPPNQIRLLNHEGSIFSSFNSVPDKFSYSLRGWNWPNSLSSAFLTTDWNQRTGFLYLPKGFRKELI